MSNIPGCKKIKTLPDFEELTLELAAGYMCLFRKEMESKRTAFFIT
jgi:hypothetical protein